jgi:hypothetical protein
MELGATPVSVSVPSLRLAPFAFITISDGTISVLAAPIRFWAGALIASCARTGETPSSAIMATMMQVAQLEIGFFVMVYSAILLATSTQARYSAIAASW